MRNETMHGNVFVRVLDPATVAFYVVESDRVNTQYRYDLETRTCSCASFKIKGRRCVHTEALWECYEEKTKQYTFKGILCGIEDGEPLTLDVECPFLEGSLGLLTHKGILLLPPSDPEYHVSDLIERFKGGLSVFPIDPSDPNVGFDLRNSLAERRGYMWMIAELQVSLCRDIKLDNKRELEDYVTDELAKLRHPNFQVLFAAVDMSDTPEETKAAKKRQRDTKLSVWKKTPKPETFYVKDDVWEALLWSICKGATCCITGPTGVGKSELIIEAAVALDKTIEIFNFGAMSEPRASLLGVTHYDKSKGTFFDQSRFVSAFSTEGNILMLDEITRAGVDAFNILFPAMDRQGTLSLDEAEGAPVIDRADNVSFIATANVGLEYTGTNEMDRALKDRFAVKIELTYPPEADEVKILRQRAPHVLKSNAYKLVKVANTQRSMARSGDFEIQISTRMLIDCALMLGDGIAFTTAINFALLGCLSSEGAEGSERQRCALIMQKQGLL